MFLYVFRAINNGLLDTYQLKSLDAVLEAPVEEMILERTRSNRLRLGVKDGEPDTTEGDGEDRDGDGQIDDLDEYDNFALRDEYDKVIVCLGFKFDDSIFTK